MVLDRFLKYVKVDTMSAEEASCTPSTKKQFDLANIMKEELLELGLKDASVDEHAIVTAHLPSNCNSKLSIGFLAHLDTIPGFSGTNVNPIVHKNYDGKDIVLKNNIVLSPKQFPYMKNMIGKTLISADGTTVLGADDKAGIANIMEMLEYFVTHPEVKHVNICVSFTPDEEIGGGIDSFKVKEFGADYAYTIDGGPANTINYENFNAASAKIHIKGLDIHPGSAKGYMVNASVIATEFESMLPTLEKPMYTEKYEGFNHLVYINGEVGYADMQYILRNHVLAKLQAQKKLFEEIATKLNKKYGEGTVSVELKDSYFNMKEAIAKDPRSIDRLTSCMKRVGINPEIEPIRGGTDGAKLTQMGLLTPNIGTGGYNCHGPYEFAVLEEMLEVVKILVEIAKE